jgi:UDP-3-O-[3-hydroxymyristoyl] N-acetylglucosamine deacetylase
MIKQKTFKNAIGCMGVGLHSGKKISMTLMPSVPDSGIVFKRTDIFGGGAIIKATWENVVETTLCTTLGNVDGVTVATVEHLMAALSASGIDNAVIEINGPEVPVMDGSAAPFIFLAECAGTVEQNKPRRYIHWQ